MMTMMKQREKRAAIRQEQEIAELKKTEQEQIEVLVSLTEQCKRQKEELKKLQRYSGGHYEYKVPAKVSVSKFSGTEDLEDYLVQFDAVSKLQHLDEDDKAIGLFQQIPTNWWRS